MMDGLGALVWGLLAAGQFRAALEGSTPLLSLSLCLQSGLAAFLLLRRRGVRRESPWPQRVVAWLAALAPQAMAAPGRAPIWAQAVSLAGVWLALLALVRLGKAFAIAPADRGLVTGGVYRWLRHPMYAGELLSLLPVAALLPSARNLAVVGGVVAAMVLRIRWEERILSGYQTYAQKVRWRVLPWVW